MNFKRGILLLVLGAISLFGPASGTPASLQFHMSEDARPYVETVTSWMVRNTVSKLSRPVEPATAQEVRSQFDLVASLAQASSSSGPARTALPEVELLELRTQLKATQPGVERAMEEKVAQVALRSGLGQQLAGQEYLAPPLYFKFEALPNLLVVSPRDRIERAATVLLESDLLPSQAEELERKVERRQLSALVTPIGGLGVYPSMVPQNSDPRWTFRTVAHEWVHQFLAFRPLGWRYALGDENDARMITVNETAAEVVGRELGDLAYAELFPDAPNSGGTAGARDTEFRKAMREIRTGVDGLLSEGRVEEAEAYMETARLDLEERGYYIRKLNQAYFAFHGSYAEDPSAGGRTGAQISERVRQLRAESPTPGAFLWKISTVSTYEDFLRLTAPR